MKKIVLLLCLIVLSAGTLHSITDTVPITCRVRRALAIEWTARVGAYYLIESSQDGGKTWYPVQGRRALQVDECQIVLVQTFAEVFRVKERD